MKRWRPYQTKIEKQYFDLTNIHIKLYLKHIIYILCWTIFTFLY